MKPGYEEYRPDRGAETVQLNVRITPEMRKELELIAFGDGDPREERAWASLAYEGLGRVIEDRMDDTDWIRQASQRYGNRAKELERRITEIRSLVDTPPDSDASSQNCRSF